MNLTQWLNLNDFNPDSFKENGIDSFDSLKGLTEEDMKIVIPNMGERGRLRSRMKLLDHGQEDSNAGITEPYQNTARSINDGASTSVKAEPSRKELHMLLRDAAKASRIWKKAYRIDDISPEKKVEFFNAIEKADKDSTYNKKEIWQELSRMLQNRRKYLLDKVQGKNGRGCRRRSLSDHDLSAISVNSDSSVVKKSKLMEPIAPKSDFVAGAQVSILNQANGVTIGQGTFIRQKDTIFSEVLLKKKCVQENIELYDITGKISNFSSLALKSIFLWKTAYLKETRLAVDKTRLPDHDKSTKASSTQKVTNKQPKIQKIREAGQSTSVQTIITGSSTENNLTGTGSSTENNLTGTTSHVTDKPGLPVNFPTRVYKNVTFTQKLNITNVKAKKQKNKEYTDKKITSETKTMTVSASNVNTGNRVAKCRPVIMEWACKQIYLGLETEIGVTSCLAPLTDLDTLSQNLKILKITPKMVKLNSSDIVKNPNYKFLFCKTDIEKYFEYNVNDKAFDIKKDCTEITEYLYAKLDTYN